ncbi:ECF transporter S component [[Clostridium] spiroforme]|nr:ECF transporter S component [Thomasclavelia spiroformis]MBM6880951.1 ECF transporter S component [Thomasclavelia spiroformis]MBM6931237.1 ECF transporter S component [Thomasclavelia spiroformis]
MNTKKITTIGMLCAMAIIINLMISFPIIPSVSFLKYDPKDIIIVIGGFIFGPLTSLIMSAITSVLEIVYRGGTILDILMNMISTCTFAMTAAYCYKKMHTKKGAVLGLVFGIIACTVSMIIWNYVIDPIYFQMPRSAVVAMLPAIALFNIIKCGLNMAVTLFLYKPVITILRNTNLVEKHEETSSLSQDIMILASFILITGIVLILSFQQII